MDESGKLGGGLSGETGGVIGLGVCVVSVLVMLLIGEGVVLSRILVLMGGNGSGMVELGVALMAGEVWVSGWECVVEVSGFKLTGFIRLTLLEWELVWSGLGFVGVV